MIQPQEAKDEDNSGEEGSSYVAGRERAGTKTAHQQLLDRPTTREHVRVTWPSLTRRDLKRGHLRRAMKHLQRNAWIGGDSVRGE
jgi:hypothetical protein